MFIVVPTKKIPIAVNYEIPPARVPFCLLKEFFPASKLYAHSRDDSELILHTAIPAIQAARFAVCVCLKLF